MPNKICYGGPGCGCPKDGPCDFRKRRAQEDREIREYLLKQARQGSRKRLAK